MKYVAIILGLGLYLMTGCTPSLEINLSEQKQDGVSLTLSSTTALSPAQVLRIVAPIRSTDNYTHGRLRKVLGEVKVVKVLDERLVLAELIDGTVTGGATVEILE